MAFVPDDSYDRRLSEKLPQILWEFYEYACRKRNHETRRSSATIDVFIQKYGYKRASKFLLQNQIAKSHWFGGTDGEYELLVGDFSPVDEQADRRKAMREQSKKSDSAPEKSKKIDSGNGKESKNLDEKSKKLDCIYKEYQLSSSIEEYEREISACDIDNFEPFPETENLVDGDFRFHTDLTLFWIQTQKQLSRKNFPANDWLELLTDLESEQISGDGFKDFYIWVESQDWVDTVSPKLLRGQIEKYKKRDKLQEKKNGKVQPNTNGNHASDAGTRNAQRVSNTRAVIDELRRQGEQEQALSG